MILCMYCFSALTGKRKQSVEDAERLLSLTMADFMKKKGYKFENRYISVLANWRRATDERGLSELKRCRYNYELLSFILDELKQVIIMYTITTYAPTHVI